MKQNKIAVILTNHTKLTTKIPEYQLIKPIALFIERLDHPEYFTDKTQDILE